jgi:Mn2+/Fe2+ NRAMP family transporter
LIGILFVSQVVNAVLLVPLLFVLIRIGSDESVMGEHRNRRIGLALACGAASVLGLSLVALVAASVV